MNGFADKLTIQQFLTIDIGVLVGSKQITLNAVWACLIEGSVSPRVSGNDGVFSLFEGVSGCFTVTGEARELN